MNSFMRSFLNKLAVIAITLLACVVLLELWLRLEGRLPSNVTDGIFVQHGGSYRLGKNVEKVTRWSSRSFLTRTNSLGFRDAVNGPVDLAGKPYFVFLGDSVTFGNGVDYEDTFVGMLAEKLGPEGFKVLNLAIGGHHLPDQIEVLKDMVAAADHPPKAVVVCMTDGLAYSFDLKTEGILVKDGYLFSAKSWKMAYVRTILGNTSAAYCFFRDAIRKAQARWFKPHMDDLPPYLKLFAKSSRMHDPGTIQRFESSLNDLDLYCRSVGTAAFYAYLPLIEAEDLAKFVTQAGKSPSDFDAGYYETLIRSYCGERTTPLADLGPALLQLYRSGVPLTFGDDPHYDTPAHRVVADGIYESLRAASLLDSGGIR
jgi:hypothetical protein